MANNKAKFNWPPIEAAYRTGRYSFAQLERKFAEEGKRLAAKVTGKTPADKAKREQLLRTPSAGTISKHMRDKKISKDLSLEIQEKTANARSRQIKNADGQYETVDFSAMFADDAIVDAQVSENLAVLASHKTMIADGRSVLEVNMGAAKSVLNATCAEIAEAKTNKQKMKFLPVVKEAAQTLNSLTSSLKTIVELEFKVHKLDEDQDDSHADDLRDIDETLEAFKDELPAEFIEH